ncbi:MAG: magnesium transporter [Halobacteriaceae archaeon]
MTVKSVIREAYTSAIPVVLISAFGGLLAGTILGGMEAQLRSVQGLLVMIPAFLAIRGSVYGSLGSRLSTALHQGLLEPALSRDPRLVNSVIAAQINGLSATLFAAILTYGILLALGRSVSLIKLLVIAFIAGLLAGLALTVVILVVVIIGYRRGMDPDNLVGPAMTTAGDVFGMAALFVATEITIMLL